jgi:hypothetical protein
MKNKHDPSQISNSNAIFKSKVSIARNLQRGKYFPIF